MFEIFKKIFNKVDNNLSKGELIDKIELKDEKIIMHNKELENVKNEKEINYIDDDENLKLTINDNDTINEKRDKLISAIIKKTKRKCYYINPVEINEGDIFISKFGGLGYWDNDMEYPLDSNGNKLVLLAQFNFDKDKFDTPDLPKNGLLQFYVSPESLFDIYSNDKNSYKVVFHEKVNYDIKKEDLAHIRTSIGLKNFPINKEFKLEFVESYDYINSTNADFNSILLDIIENELKIDLSNTSIYDVFGEDIMNCIDNKFMVSGNKLLGYPYFNQADPRDGEKFSDYKLLLFEMNSNRELDIIWGDCGVANFFITKNNDFSDVFFTWDYM